MASVRFGPIGCCRPIHCDRQLRWASRLRNLGPSGVSALRPDRPISFVPRLRSTVRRISAGPGSLEPVNPHTRTDLPGVSRSEGRTSLIPEADTTMSHRHAAAQQISQLKCDGTGPRPQRSTAILRIPQWRDEVQRVRLPGRDLFQPCEIVPHWLTTRARFAANRPMGACPSTSICMQRRGQRPRRCMQRAFASCPTNLPANSFPWLYGSSRARSAHGACPSHAATPRAIRPLPRQPGAHRLRSVDSAQPRPSRLRVPPHPPLRQPHRKSCGQLASHAGGTRVRFANRDPETFVGALGGPDRVARSPADPCWTDRIRMHLSGLQGTLDGRRLVSSTATMWSQNQICHSSTSTEPTASPASASRRWSCSLWNVSEPSRITSHRSQYSGFSGSGTRSAYFRAERAKRAAARSPLECAPNGPGARACGPPSPAGRLP